MILNMWLPRLLVLLLSLTCLHAQPSDDIKAALTEQTAAWNHADIPRFVATYAEHCTLVGSGISHVSRGEVLAHYRSKYPSAAEMGKLTFSDLAVSLLDDRHATAVGRWHLDRDVASGGPVGGVFSLVFEKQSNAWVIILDHTS